jgi:hypothetical protein
MARRKSTRNRKIEGPTPFEEARDELFRHIVQCGVIGAQPEHQAEWFDDTMHYMAERYSELTEDQLRELRVLGERFVQPPKGVAPQVAVSA